MLKAFIVDDEPLARDELKYLLIRSKQVQILGESDSIEDAVAGITVLKPDVVFPDIQLADENGVSLARRLEVNDHSPAIVFATAYDEYALQAFELNAVDYILKPFDENRLQKTLEKIKKTQIVKNRETTVSFSNNSNRSGKIPILVDEKIILLTYKNILYLETCNGICTLKTTDQEYKVSEPLIVLERKLNKEQFFRVHRSYIVNMDHIVEIEPWFNSTYNLIMKGGSKVPVSRTYIKELKQLLGF